MKSNYKRQLEGEKYVIVTDVEISENAHKMTHREFVAQKFMREHRLYVIDFTKLEYRQSRCQTAVAVWGKIGQSLSHRLAE